MKSSMMIVWGRGKGTRSICGSYLSSLSQQVEAGDHEFKAHLGYISNFVCVCVRGKQKEERREKNKKK